MTTLQERVSYAVQYTIGSYADAVASVPIVVAKALEKTSERITGMHLSIPGISKINAGRERLREKLDTRAGAVYIQSSLLGTAAFLTTGAIGGQILQSTLEKMVEHTAPRDIAVSLGTVGLQYLASNTVFMGNEVRANKAHYVNGGDHIKATKVLKKFGKFVLSSGFLEAGLFCFKGAIQAYALHRGNEAWESSAIADAITMPIRYAASIPLALAFGFIETNKTSKLFKRNQ